MGCSILYSILTTWRFPLSLSSNEEQEEWYISLKSNAKIVCVLLIFKASCLPIFSHKIFPLNIAVFSTAWQLVSQCMWDSCNDYLISPDPVVLILMDCMHIKQITLPPKSGTDQWDWRVVYEFYTLAFWHLHNIWPHTHNTAWKTHTLHKPIDHCTKNSHVGVKLTVTLKGKSLFLKICINIYHGTDYITTCLLYKCRKNKKWLVYHCFKDLKFSLFFSISKNTLL
jgi:hypothetical protein